MFQPLTTSDAEAMLEERAFGFSHLRLLPKAKGMRFIFNMKRRVRGGTRAQGPWLHIAPNFRTPTIRCFVVPAFLYSPIE